MFKKNPRTSHSQSQQLFYELNQGLRDLKKRYAPHSPGNAYLYKLPWYLVIGKEQTGKSDFIKNSGFDFSPLGKTSSEDTGANANHICNWWISDHALLLEITTQLGSESMSDEHLYEVFTFLKNKRKNKPIDGLIITVDISETASLNDEELNSYAASLENKIIDEFVRTLKISFPLYLVFTKCDKLEGFYKFFSDLEPEEYSQIWGITFPYEFKKESPDDIFNTNYDTLFACLLNRRLFSLSNEMPLPDMYSAFEFPHTFLSLKNKIYHFIKLLFTFSTSQKTARPLVRGIYFTSSIGDKSQQQSPGSYFINNLLKDIILPERFLVQSESSLWTGPAFVSVILALILIFVMTISFVRNRTFIKDVQQTTENLYYDKMDNNFESLESSRLNLTTLDEYENNVIPFTYGLKYYRGTKVNKPARKVYFERFNERILIPLGRAMEKQLGETDKDIKEKKSEGLQSVLATEVENNLYRAYTMLTDKTPPIDKNFLSPFMSDYFYKDYKERTGKLPDGVFRENVKEQIDFYLSQFGRDDVPYLERNNILTANFTTSVSSSMTSSSLEQEIISKIRTKGREQFPLVNLKRIMKDYKKTNTALMSEYVFSGIYTKQGWNEYVKQENQKQSKTGSMNISRRALIRKLDEHYFKSLVDNWRGLFKKIHIKKYDTLDSALIALHELASEDESSLVYLFTTFSSMTQKIGISDSAARQKIIDNEFERVYDVLGKGRTTSLVFENYLNELSNLHKELLKIKEKSNKDALTAIKNETKIQLSGSETTFLSAPWDASQNMMNKIDKKNREVFRTILEQPIINTWELLLLIIQNDVENQWHSHVCEYFTKNLKDYYPFTQSTQDVSIEELSNFFNPSSGVFSIFYDKEIIPFFIMNNGTLTPKTWSTRGLSLPRDMVDNMSKAQNMSMSIFPEKKSEPLLSFELCPIPISDPDIERILLSINDSKVDYRFQPQWWFPVTWPGKKKVHASRIDITSTTPQSIIFNGHMSLFRLMNHGQVMPMTDEDRKSDCEIKEGDKKVSWKVGLNKDTSYNVQYYVRFQENADIFEISRNLTDFKCEVHGAD